MKLKRLQGELWTGDLQRLAIGQQRRCQYCIIVTERRKGKFFEAGKFHSGSLLALQFKEEEGRKKRSETKLLVNNVAGKNLFPAPVHSLQ